MKNQATQEISKQTLNEIRDLANEKIDSILSELGIDIDNTLGSADDIRCACPVHDGDNPTAFSYSTKFKRWKCFTGKCEENNDDIFGLVKLIKAKEKSDFSFIEAVNWLSSILGLKVSQIAISQQDKEIRSILNEIKLRKSIKELTYNNDSFKEFPVSLIDGKVEPSKYFLDKGFSENILRKYNVGFCKDPSKPMYQRSYAPVLDEFGKKVLGVTGRTIFEKCELCGNFHKGGNGCPGDNPYVRAYPKWMHYGFKKSLVLYNIWFAREYIKKSRTALISEGPKECWYMEQNGIHNSLCIMGLAFSKYHLSKLIEMGVVNLVFGLDNDEKGQEARQIISNNLSNYFNIYNIKDYVDFDSDIDEISVSDVENKLKPFLKSLEQYGE